MYEKLYEYFHNARTQYPMQHALFRLLQQQQPKQELRRFLGTSLMDLFKACDCLPHNWLRAKLGANELDYSSHFMLDYIISRKKELK